MVMCTIVAWSISNGGRVDVLGWYSCMSSYIAENNRFEPLVIIMQGPPVGQESMWMCKSLMQLCSYHMCLHS